VALGDRVRAGVQVRRQQLRLLTEHPVATLLRLSRGSFLDVGGLLRRARLLVGGVGRRARARRRGGDHADSDCGSDSHQSTFS
jgi:hypothetical protein